MGTAAQERENARVGKGCLGKASPDEPVFILRGQDDLAEDLVEEWAIRAHVNGCGDDKVNEALELAEKMRQWEPQKYPD